jgi:conjugal transfer pilus assembly protein TraK
MRRLLTGVLVLLGSVQGPYAAAESVPPPLDMSRLGAPAKRPTVVLPSIGTATPSTIKQNIVRISEGQNELVYVGLGFPNRIATPFANPQAIGANTVDFTRIGRDIYLIPDNETPIGVFIADKEDTGRVATLTLIPKAGLPGQNILLVLDGATSGGPANPKIVKQEMAEPAADHVDGIKQLMRVFVQGAVPPGYQEGTLKVGAARVGQVAVVPEKVYTGTGRNMYRYRIENVGREPIELNEASFSENGVHAVAFWPRARLAPTETTTVFILTSGDER